MATYSDIFQMLILVNIVHCITGSRPYDIEIESFRREFNETIFSKFTVDMINVGNRQVFNGSIVNAIDIDQFDMVLAASLVRRNGQNSKLLNLTLIGCDFFDNRYTNFVQLPYQILSFLRKSFKSMPKKCPIKKDTEVVVSNLYVDAEQLPAYLPEARFNFKFSVRNKEAFGYSFYVTGAIVSKEKKKFG